MPRLFTGLEIPEDVGRSLTMLRGGLPGARWVEPENYHLTLRFIGDIDDSLARDIAYMLRSIRHSEFDLRLEGLDAFGGRKPRAVFASVPTTRPLFDLQSDQERLLQRLGLLPEGRKFTPHVTLARLRDTRHRDVADFLATRSPYRSKTFQVSRFVLFSARASSGGGPYVVESAYPLGISPS